VAQPRAPRIRPGPSRAMTSSLAANAFTARPDTREQCCQLFLLRPYPIGCDSRDFTAESLIRLSVRQPVKLRPHLVP
jgi:hypothetical protein